ncbi:MAG: lipoprotein-releasing system ATP-binding protein LolD [Candidatus Marinimicrobia bacterium]|nr:lipoprotein-releasing system ATP-binding protein LolD [Candidatus Neomarinimicrobiota bacterium]
MMINAIQITKSYKNGDSKLKVLNRISIKIDSGEIITIMGQSGAGKSTLLHILGTLDYPDKGKIELNGLNINNYNKKELSLFRNQEIGFVFQSHHLIPELTVFENILVPSWIYGRGNESIKYAEFLLEFVGLIDKKKLYPVQLSGGERSRISILRAIINRPSVILADEPTGNLDIHNSRLLIELFIKINKDFNQSILISTHDYDVAKIGDKKFILDNGHLKKRE